MNLKEFGLKRLWHNFKGISRNSTRETKKKHEISQDKRFSSRDLNLGPSKYEAGVLTTRPRR
jgi:hypothetical protein